MAITDAISVACKQLGIGASIYSGSKYIPILEKEATEKEKEEAFQRHSKMLDEFLREIDTVASREDSVKVYNKYKSLTGDKIFDDKMKEIGKKFPAPPKTQAS
jgi:hypothetical protein